MARWYPNYDLAREIGADSVEVDASSVGTFLADGARRYGPAFADALRMVAILVNGRNIRYLQGKRTRLGDDDEVWFVVPSAGG